MYHCTVELQLRTLQAGPVHLTFLYTLTATNSSVLHAMLIKNHANFAFWTNFLQYLKKDMIANQKDILFFYSADLSSYDFSLDREKLRSKY